jgi:PAS domain S-box-containing protein
MKKNGKEICPEPLDRATIFYALIDMLDDGIVIVQKGVIIFATQMIAQLLGTTAEQLIGSSFTVRFSKAGLHENIWPPVAKIVDTLKRSDGGLLQFELNCSLIVYRKKRAKLVIIRDITERKRLEQELELRAAERNKSHERFRNLVELLPEMVFECNTEGYFTYANQQALATFQLGPDDFERGLHITQIIAEKDYQRTMESIHRILTEQVDHGKYTVRRKDGTEFPVYVRANRIESDGRVTGFRGIVVNLTESRKAEAERNRLENQLRQVQKMNALGTMAGGIAHDFNNILATITGFTEMLLEDSADDDPRKHSLENVLKASLRGRDLVKQMLAFSRKHDQVRKPLRLKSAIEETIDFLRASIPTTIGLKMNIENESGHVLADTVQLQQVIINLCNNAVDAMRETGGTLTIRVSDCFASERHVHLGIAPPDQYLLIEVSDTGKGDETRCP